MLIYRFFNSSFIRSASNCKIFGKHYVGQALCRIDSIEPR